jgi:hypothetical protein
VARRARWATAVAKVTTSLEVANLANALWEGRGGRGLAVSVADVADYLRGSTCLSTGQREVISEALKFLLGEEPASA